MGYRRRQPSPLVLGIVSAAVANPAQFLEQADQRQTFTRRLPLLELNGKDFRREHFEVRKATVASLLRPCPFGLPKIVQACET